MTESKEKALLRAHKGRPNQRIEWVGDAVISAFVRQILFEMFPNARVACLSDAEKLIVCNRLLAQATGRKAYEAEINCGRWFAENKMDLVRGFCAFLISKHRDICGHLEVLNDLSRIGDHEHHARALRVLCFKPSTKSKAAIRMAVEEMLPA